jgi:hypothetical protein
MEGFTLFEAPRRGKPQTEPRVSLSTNGTLTLNTLALELFNDSTVECVQLLYSEESRQVALKGVPTDAPYSYRLRQSGKSESRSVSARAFSEFYGISLDERQEFTPWAVEPGIVAFSLENEVPDENATQPKGRRK